MLITILRNTGLFILLLAIQLLIMDNIQLSGYINPYVYILIVIILPFEIPSWALLLVSFLAGLTLDIFSGTPGLHTSSTVFAGFIRPYVLNLISPREGYEPGDMPGISTYGFRWFIIYLLLMVFMHHFVLFMVEVFRFEYFLRTILRILLSTGISVIFILIIQSLIIRR